MLKNMFIIVCDEYNERETIKKIVDWTKETQSKETEYKQLDESTMQQVNDEMSRQPS